MRETKDERERENAYMGDEGTYIQISHTLN